MITTSLILKNMNFLGIDAFCSMVRLDSLKKDLLNDIQNIGTERRKINAKQINL